MVRGQFGGALCLGNTLPALIGVETCRACWLACGAGLLPGGVFVAQQINYDRILAQGLHALPVRRLADDGGELVFERVLAPQDDGIVGVTERVLLCAPAPRRSDCSTSAISFSRVGGTPSC
jgi:hypothetical protein